MGLSLSFFQLNSFAPFWLISLPHESRNDRLLFTVIRVGTPCRFQRLIDDQGEEYRVLEGIHLVVNIIHAFHRTKSAWEEDCPKDIKQNTTIVFALMLLCINSLVFAGCPSLQYGFTAALEHRAPAGGEPLEEIQRLSLDAGQRSVLLADGKIRSADQALRWFSANSPLTSDTCQLKDVIQHVYPTPRREGRHPEALNFANRLAIALKNMQKVIKVSDQSPSTLDHVLDS